MDYKNNYHFKDEEACENLAIAIIVGAAKDYRRALRRLRRNPNNQFALREKSELEAFFRSGWFETLSETDGEMIINRLKKEYES